MDKAEENKSDSYIDLVKKVGNGEVSGLYDWADNVLKDFIIKKKYQDKAIISDDILKHVIIDYFVDIDRLKEFQNIKEVHTSKIYAYFGFWVLRHKPLQITSTDGAADLAFINEEFVSCLIRSYLFSEPENVAILENKRDTVDNFVDTMLYYFKYREYSAKSIEIMILAFQAGCAYQYSAERQ